MKFARIALAPALALAGLATAAAPSLAQGYSYQSPGYSYESPGYSYRTPGSRRTRPPYTYQPPPYSYTPPNYSYSPPGYSYTPPGYYRPPYRANTPDYNRAYDYPLSAYGDRRTATRWRRQNRDPVYNRFGNPRNPTDVWNSAPPYRSDTR